MKSIPEFRLIPEPASDEASRLPDSNGLARRPVIVTNWVARPLDLFPIRIGRAASSVMSA